MRRPALTVMLVWALVILSCVQPRAFTAPPVASQPAATQPDEKTSAQLIQQLGKDMPGQRNVPDTAARDAAMQRLIEIGEPVRSAVVAELRKTPAMMDEGKRLPIHPPSGYSDPRKGKRPPPRWSKPE